MGLCGSCVSIKACVGRSADTVFAGLRPLPGEWCPCRCGLVGAPVTRPRRSSIRLGNALLPRLLKKASLLLICENPEILASFDRISCKAHLRKLACSQTLWTQLKLVKRMQFNCFSMLITIAPAQRHSHALSVLASARLCRAGAGG